MKIQYCLCGLINVIKAQNFKYIYFVCVSECECECVWWGIRDGYRRNITCMRERGWVVVVPFPYHITCFIKVVYLGFNSYHPLIIYSRKYDSK